MVNICTKFEQDPSSFSADMISLYYFLDYYNSFYWLLHQDYFVNIPGKSYDLHSHLATL